MTDPTDIPARLAAIWPHGTWGRDGADWLCKRPYARVQRLPGSAIRYIGVVSAMPHFDTRIHSGVGTDPATVLQAAVDALRERVRRLAEKVGLPTAEQERAALPAGIDWMGRVAALALAFGRVTRATRHEDGVRPESDAEHAVMLGLLACPIAVGMGMRSGRAAEYALVHDLAEAYCGDTNSFDIGPAAAARKAEVEAAAIARLRADFADVPWLLRRVAEYEAQDEPEARLVRYLDKVTPKLTHRLNGAAAIREMGKSFDDFRRAHRAQGAMLRERYPELAERIGPIFDAVSGRAEAAWPGGAIEAGAHHEPPTGGGKEE